MISIKKKIFFGHQSVGFNILEGLKDILVGEQINIIETRNPQDCNSPGLFHCRIGENHKPDSKINDFVNLMNNGFGDNIDVACFKFCYVDIQDSTNVEHLFDYYKTKIGPLISRYKNTHFMHVTVPLRTVEHGFRRIAKNLLGRSSISAMKNLKRQTYNKLLLNEYGSDGTVFDLAHIESTYPSGSRCISRHNGIDVYSLVPKFTDDGGHLNTYGRKQVADNFLQAIN